MRRLCSAILIKNRLVTDGAALYRHLLLSVLWRCIDQCVGCRSSQVQQRRQSNALVYLSKFHITFKGNEVITEMSTFHCNEVRNSGIFWGVLLRYFSSEPNALQVVDSQTGWWHDRVESVYNYDHQSDQLLMLPTQTATHSVSQPFPRSSRREISAWLCAEQTRSTVVLLMRASIYRPQPTHRRAAADVTWTPAYLCIDKRQAYFTHMTDKLFEELAPSRPDHYWT